VGLIVEFTESKMRHYVEMIGPNSEELGRIESDESVSVEESYASIRKKIADHIIANKIEVIQFAFCGVTYKDGWMPIPQGLANSLIRTAIKENWDRIQTARKEWIK
jgi:hypothetical protein